MHPADDFRKKNERHVGCGGLGGSDKGIAQDSAVAVPRGLARAVPGVLQG